jgi:uncharacterized protein YjbI with pentapeptide repeats
MAKNSANEKYLSILTQGVSAWNEWRELNRVRPKFDRADFSNCNFEGANFGYTMLYKGNLSKSNFRYADFRRANLSRADLSETDFSYSNFDRAYLRTSNLSRSNFSNADFSRANLGRTNLIGANLSGSDLFGVDFSDADLDDANLSYARVGWTRFGNNDLSNVKGLDTVIHNGPSTVGVDTLYKSGGRIADAFLHGCGVPNSFIVQIPSLVGAVEPIQFYSCFISYSSKDQEFADKIYSDLQKRSVRCWFAPEDLKIGDKFRARIDEVIRVYDKLLLVLSSNSIPSSWVEKEVESAIEREQKHSRAMLFPVRLDNSVMEVDSGWPADIRRQRHIGNFSQWKNSEAYHKAFERLLRDLKASG